MLKIIHPISFTVCFLFLTLLASLPLRAETLYGLAMHGEPKYTVDDTHLEYANPDAPKGGTLRQAAIGTFDTLNPYSLKGNAVLGLNLVYDRLMARVWDEPFTMYPLIAQSIEVPEDRSSLTVHINPAARFEDGSAITADDIVFSFETLKEQGRPNMRRIYDLVSSVETPDSMTVTFNFGEGYDQETVMILAMMPVLSKAWWQDRDFSETTLEKPVLNGPYTIEEIDPGRRIVYKRNPDYWGKDLLPNKGHFNFDTVIYDYFRDDTVAFEAFKAGDIDIRREWNAGKWASAYDFPAIKSGDVVAQSLPHGRPQKVKSLIYNTRRAPFDEPKVREALQYVLNFNWLNDNLFHGQYKRVDSYFPNAHLAAKGEPDEPELAVLEPYRNELPPSVFGPVWTPPQAPDMSAHRTNLRKAGKLLNDADWIIQDGKRVKASDPSQAFIFEIIIGAPEDEKIALSFIKDLKRIGIEANVRVLDSAAFLSRLQNYDYDMVLYHWLNSLSPGTEQMLYWTCQAAEMPGQWNYTGICNPAIDELSASIAAAKTREELVTRTHALDRALLSGFYMIPLYYSDADYVAYKARIAHPETTPLYGMVLETWWNDGAQDAKSR